MASPNDTLITPGSGYITDNSGNFFQVTTAGTVDMNFKPLGYTANVTDAAYVNGNFWQQNSSGLWWEYTGNPASPWTGLGTSASPLAGSPSQSGTLISSPGSGAVADNQGDVFTVTSRWHRRYERQRTRLHRQRHRSRRRQWPLLAGE